VRSGKTFSSLIAWLLFVLDGPPGELLMFGRTERTLKRNILDPLAELLDEADFRLVSGSGECFIFGRRVYLAGANDERSEGKIRGLTLAGAYGDEITLAPESFWTMLLSRLSVRGARLFGTTNTDSPAHWLKKKYVDREKDLDLRVFQFRLDDNPSLDQGYVAALRREYVGLWKRRYIDGEWALAEGAVFDMFDESRHVVATLPQDAQKQPVAIIQSWAGSDYGTVNPAVFLMASQVAQRLYIHDEWRHDSRLAGRQMTDADYSKAFRNWTARLRIEPRWTFVDPSAASFMAQLYRDKVRGVTPADNAVLDGIRDVSTLLGNDQLAFVGPTTRATVEEMTGYGWDPKAQARGEDKPMKVTDHGPDTVRYLCRGTQKVWRRWAGTRYQEAA
jgi:PBSX family phage terminase large subunit